MLSAKIPTLVLVACLCLLLSLSSPGMALACLSEPLPSGAQARLGRGTVNVVQYSPDGTRLAVGGSAGIWLYDVATREVEALLTDHTEPVHSVAFSADGRILAGSGRFGTVYLWDPARAPSGTLWKATRMESGAWRSVRTAGPWPLAVSTARSACGT